MNNRYQYNYCIKWSQLPNDMVFLLVLFLIPWYLYGVLIVPDRIDGEKSHWTPLQNIPYFNWNPSNKWDFYYWFTSASQWDPSHVNRDPYQKSFYWDPGGIWWDSGEIWTGIPVDWDPSWMCTGIPVGYGLDPGWMCTGIPVGFGLGSRWMCTGIPVGYGGIWTGIPVNVDWDPYQISQWDRGRDPSGIPVGIPVLFSLEVIYMYINIWPFKSQDFPKVSPNAASYQILHETHR